MSNSNAPAIELEPVVSLMWEAAEGGTYVARMSVSGLKSERQAQAAVEHMQRLFCGQGQEANS